MRKILPQKYCFTRPLKVTEKASMLYTLYIMVITYQGGAFVKVQFGDITIAVNPISKDSKLKSSRFGADIALISVNHADFSGTDQVSFGERNAFAVTGPGEYEIKDVFIKGFKSESNYGGEPRLNTIYTVNLENMNLCFLGALSSKEIPSEANEEIESIDVLFVPIGNDGVLTPSDAYKLAVKLEPKLIVPLYWGNNVALKAFLKEAGEEAVKPVDKLTLKKKDLEGKDADVVVLEPAA
ncbi:MAG: hypothetical protein RLZZ67_181 [Candidatus Parcubacteria bacterium]